LQYNKRFCIKQTKRHQNRVTTSQIMANS